MEKTYKLLDHTEPLPIAEIRQLYQDYWVFLVKVKLDERGRMVSGVPVVSGITPFDGAEDNIYDKYWAEEYEVRADINLLPFDWSIPSVFWMELPEES